jgi:hypothetical protein
MEGHIATYIYTYIDKVAVEMTSVGLHSLHPIKRRNYKYKSIKLIKLRKLNPVFAKIRKNCAQNKNTHKVTTKIQRLCLD